MTARTGEPKEQTVGNLANALILAQGDDGAENLPTSPQRGKAVFLVGAGCSASAGIPMADGVAQICALYLARRYSLGKQFPSADAAIEWLLSEGKIPPENVAARAAAERRWGELYSYFFEDHLRSANQQREIINQAIGDGRGLNWAHACLGELVKRRFVHTVLTTNFDQLVLQGIIRTGIIPVVADNMASLDRVTSAPLRPQVIHLHGSMHTYNLRNSKNAVEETEEDPGFARVVTNLMRGSDLLVVVGYGGGEEGIMKVLCEAARQDSQLVVYWVTYGGGFDGLSERAKELVRCGENKFIIQTSSGADEFFWSLMEELKVGPPEWIRDPIGAMQAAASELLNVEDNEVISVLVGDYRRQIVHAVEERLQVGPREKAAQLRATGDFVGSNEALADVDLSHDRVALRLHALNMHSMFERDPSDEDSLRQAIREFEQLAAASEGEEKFKNLMSLADAYYDLADLERRSSNQDAAARDKEEAAFATVVTLTTNGQTTFTKALHPKEWARLELFKAQALHFPGERKGRENAAKLQSSIESYRGAIGIYDGSRDPKAAEARAGLAGALEVLGSITNQEGKIREALGLHLELVDAWRARSEQGELAAAEYNRSGCHLALAKLRPHDAAEQLRAASEAAAEAHQLYLDRGDLPWAEIAQDRRSEIEAEAALQGVVLAA